MQQQLEGEGEEMVLQEEDLQQPNRNRNQALPTTTSKAEADDDDDDNDDAIMSVTTATLSLDDAMAVALQKKNEGNAFFANENYPKAADTYREALLAMASQSSQVATKDKVNNNNDPSCRDLQISLRSNLAQVCFRMQQFGEAEHQCTCVLDKWDGSVAKVWYRRALAREQLASAAALEVDQVEPPFTSPTATATTIPSSPVAVASVSASWKDYMHLAVDDLKQCIRLLQAQDQNDQTKTTALHALDRILKRLQTWEDNEQQQPSPVNMNGTSSPSSPSSPTTTMNGHDRTAPVPVTPTTTTAVEEPAPPRPSPDQQRQAVMKLLIARSVGLQRNNSGVQGEALFLLDWKWWCQWCRHVDFFHKAAAALADANQQQPSNNNNNVKAERVLKCMPPGAILPYNNNNHHHKKAEAADDSSTDSTDSEEDLPDDHPPGPLDNSALLLLPFCEQPQMKNGSSGNIKNGGSSRDSTRSRFYQQWYRHFQQTEEGTDNGSNASSGAKQPSSKGCVRPNVVRGFHYELIPREVYCALKSWYREKTPSICRRTTLTKSATPSGSQGELVASIQLYPTTPDTAAAATSAKPPCAACRARFATKRCTRCLSVWYCDRSCQESHWTFHKTICSKIASGKANNDNSNVLDVVASSDGRVGLNNMGNTCFMNSALQCLSHATPLTRHFLSNQFKMDVNASNPLGTGGKLAHAFDSALKELWLKPNIRNTSPTALKRAIALFAPRFAGCLQHDSQEFLAYLLDGLHEDLNRIRHAPYVEMPDADDHGKNMGVAGAEAWECHTKRNDSLVMDTFYGQFKSTCVCPNSDCGRVSVSFDAFNHISLEIPQLQKSSMWLSILLFTNPRKKEPSTTRHAFCVSRGSLIADLRLAISQVTGIPATHLVICEVCDNTIIEILPEDKPVTTIRPDETLTAYQVDPYTKSSIHIISTHALLETSATAEAEGSAEQTGNPAIRNLFGFPFLTSCDANLTCRQLWDHIWLRVRHVVVPLNDDGEEEDVDPQIEDLYRQLITIRIADGEGNSILAFPTSENGRNVQEEEPGEGEESKQVALSPYVPRNLEEKISNFLGNDCTERFLFLSLDWVESMAVPQEILNKNAGHNNVHGSTNNKKKKKTKKNNSKAKVIPQTIGIQGQRFLGFVDHQSYIEGVAKQREMEAKRGVSLDQCFETFTRPERLDEHNKWYCSNCKQHVRALKTMELFRLPNVLVVHLKRFEFRHAYRRDKLGTFVDFPLEGLDMSQHCAQRKNENGAQSGSAPPEQLYVDDGVPAVYDLFAVVNHYGRMGFGHYTAFARKWDEDDLSSDWALFDDSNVRSVGDGHDGVVSPAAYVLFYRRRTFN